MIKINGLLTALITPIENGNIDYTSLERLVERQIEAKTDFVVPLGSTGENPTVEEDEYKNIFETTVSLCKGTGTKVIAGTGTNYTSKSLKLTKMAESAGVDGILLVTPYYNKPSQAGLKAHFGTIASSTELSVMIYDVPSRTSLSLAVDTAIELSKKYENIVSIKETTEDMDRVYRLRTESGLDVIGASDTANFTYLANGAKGLMSVISNIFPKKTKELITLVEAGEFVKARELQDEFYLLNKTLGLESNPIITKAFAHELGIIDSLEYRLPMSPPSEESMKKVRETLEKYKGWG